MNALRRVAAVAVAALMATTMSVAVPTAAQATAAQCAGGANGFVDVSDSLLGVVADQRHNSVANLYLTFGQVAGQTRGWAYLGSPAGTRLGDGYLVWMDWSINGGQTWMQCGPFSSRSGQGSITSPAKNTDPTYRFRAGALVNGQQLLTDWI